MLGPASSVVEHSLCKNFVHKGTAVRISPRIFLFSRELIRTKIIDCNLQHRTCYIKPYATLIGKLLRHLYWLKRNVALKIGPMTSLLRRVGQWRHKFYYTILHYTIIYTSNLWCHHYALYHTAESLEMDEEQCYRWSKRWNMRPQITGWLAGHMIQLEIEEVSWIK